MSGPSQSVQDGSLSSPGDFTLLENSMDAVVLLDTAWRFTHVNAAFERLTGRPREQLIGTFLNEGYPLAGDPAFERELAIAAASREAGCFETHDTSRGLWYEVRPFPVGGNALGLYIRDITEHARLVNALRESEERLELAQAAADIGIWDWDVVANRTTASEAYQRLYGLPQSCPVPNHEEWLALLHRDDRDRVDREIRLALTGSQRYDTEFRVIHPDGAVRWLLGKAKVLRDAQGKPVRMIGANIDITATKQTRELARSNEELFRFAYVASHDLREPLCVIQECAASIGRRSGDSLCAESREMLNLVSDSAQRLLALTSSLLNYASLGGADSVHRERVSMKAVLDWVLMNLHASIQAAGALIHVDPLPEIEADQSRMAQLFQNLIGNALKYRDTSRPLEIRISVSERPGEFIFAVADNGIGIEPRHQDRIFEPFQRLHGRELPGVGIGLASCRRIAETHGGRIWVESQPAAGSTFFCRLPK